MGIYDELPLLATEQTIRLIKLRPASDRSAPVVLELFVASLDDNPQYAALSYCWGSSILSRSISCNNYMLDITESLQLALTSIRSLTTLPLWVDQISINQDDPPERTAQVSRMKRIYSQATKTFVYLGEPDSDLTKTACEVLQKLYKPSEDKHDDDPAYAKIYSRGTLTLLEVILRHPRLMKRAYDKDVKGAISQMVRLRYFTRKWIIQELIVSRSLFCVLGAHRIAWKPFVWQVHWEAPHAWDEQPSELLWLLGLKFLYAQERSPSLLALLFFSRFYHATDARDNVFALLGIAPDSSDFPEPDYAKPFEQVYNEISSCMIRQGNGVQMLHLVGIRTIDNGLPSWVVDWRDLDIFYSRKCFATFSAGGKAGDLKLVNDGAILRASGRIVDCVVATGQRFQADPILSNRLARYVEDCAHTFEKFYETGTSKLATWEDLASLIFLKMGFQVPDFQVWPSYEFHEDSCDFDCDFDMNPFDEISFTRYGLMHSRFQRNKLEKWLSTIGQQSDCGYLSRLRKKIGPPKTPRILVEIALINGFKTSSLEESWLRARFFRSNTRPIMTANRRLGLAPALTQERDVVCVVHGAKAPLILRPWEDGTYKIVGEAYVRGIMFGESLDRDECPVEEILIC